MPPPVVNIRTRGQLPVVTEVLDSVFADHPFIEAVVLDDASPEGTDDWLAGQSDNQVTVTVFEERTDGLLSATEESNKLSEGGRRTPRRRPMKAVWLGLHVGRMTRREASSGAGPETVCGYLPDAGRRRLSVPVLGGGCE
jgi:hypothetical protein